MAEEPSPGYLPRIDIGRPLRRSIQQNDARSHIEIEFFKSKTDEQAVFCQARWVMGSYDYINANRAQQLGSLTVLLMLPTTGEAINVNGGSWMD